MYIGMKFENTSRLALKHFFSPQTTKWNFITVTYWMYVGGHICFSRLMGVHQQQDNMFPSFFLTNWWRWVNSETRWSVLACKQFLVYGKKKSKDLTRTRDLFNLKVTIDVTDKNILTFESFNCQSITRVAPMISSLEEAKQRKKFKSPFAIQGVGDQIKTQYTYLQERWALMWGLLTIRHLFKIKKNPYYTVKWIK